MSNQPENETPQTLTSEDVRRSLLAELETSKQAIEELSHAQLEAIAGGGFLVQKTPGKYISLTKVTGRPEGAAKTEASLQRSVSAPDRMQLINVVPLSRALPHPGISLPRTQSEGNMKPIWNEHKGSWES